MDLVQRLCEASTNLVKIFPHDDRPVRYERRICALSHRPSQQLLTQRTCAGCTAASGQPAQRRGSLPRQRRCLMRLIRVLMLPFPFAHTHQLESRPGHHGLYFPMGRETAQVLRLVADETVLLTSREKAPFLLLVEVCAAPL